MTGQDVVARALGAIGKGCKYKLGAGGRRWHKDTPWFPIVMTCDCSGFVAWCLDVDRYVKHERYAPWFGNWLETTAILKDAKDPAHGFFSEVPWHEARLGDLLVYGDGDGRQGHVGVVSSASPTGPLSVIHCSMGNWKLEGDAIRQTDVRLFLYRRAIVARYSELA